MRWRCFWIERLFFGCYRRLDNKALIYGLPPPGALFVAKAMERNGWEYRGEDGLNVVCMTPLGRWYIDGRAGNCTRPDDKAHRCWVRHGTRGGVIHVDKDGNTCAAGNGSFKRLWFHGYLHHGELYDHPAEK